MSLKLIIFLACMCYALTAAQFQFTPMEDDTPLIINKLGTAHLTYDSFKLVFFADLTPFYRLKSNIKTAVATIKNLTTVLHKPTYTTAAGQLEHQLQMMNVDDDTLESFRSKRFILCEFCGKIQHYAIGVMDAATACEYDKVINGIKTAALENRELFRNQSEIFQTALRFNTNTFGRLEAKINEFAQFSNNQTNEIKKIQLEMDQNTLIQYTQLLISEYYRIFGQIRRTLSNARNGKIMELIPKRQFASDLKQVGLMLNSSQSLPIDHLHEDPMHILEFSQVKSTWPQNNCGNYTTHSRTGTFPLI